MTRLTNLIKSKRLFKLLLLIVAVGTLITVALVFLLPFNFKPNESNETIINEIINRIENAAKLRNEVAFISFTPFMWDEGYYFNNTVNEDAIKKITKSKVEYKQLKENEQRLVFFYEGRLIADLIILKDEIYFDIEPGRIYKKEWLDIDGNNSEGIRLF